MASLRLFRIKQEIYQEILLISQLFACMQSGLTQPPPVHRLAVCAAHLVVDIGQIFDSWMDVVHWIHLVQSLQKSKIITTTTTLSLTWGTRVLGWMAIMVSRAATLR